MHYLVPERQKNPFWHLPGLRALRECDNNTTLCEQIEGVGWPKRHQAWRADTRPIRLETSRRAMGGHRAPERRPQGTRERCDTSSEEDTAHQHQLSKQHKPGPEPRRECPPDAQHRGTGTSHAKPTSRALSQKKTSPEENRNVT